MTSTNYTNQTASSQNYSDSIYTEDVLLLETGDELLLENDTDSILLEYLGRNSTNFSGISLNSTNYT
jgi:hypothetical protein